MIVDITGMETNVPQHIEVIAGVCGGKPRVVGHRIRVQDVAVWHEAWGMTPDEIVSQFPQITLADVYAALAYYHDHRDEIRRDMETQEAVTRAAQAQYPSKLLKKLAG